MGHEYGRIGSRARTNWVTSTGKLGHEYGHINSFLTIHGQIGSRARINWVTSTDKLGHDHEQIGSRALINWVASTGKLGHEHGQIGSQARTNWVTRGSRPQVFCKCDVILNVQTEMYTPLKRFQKRSLFIGDVSVS